MIKKIRKGFGQCAFCHTDFDIECPVYVQERCNGKIKCEKLICPNCIKKLEVKK